MLKILGGSLSPFVRKTHIFCREKGIQFEYIPVSPGDSSPEFQKASPIGKIPAMIDGDLAISDSSVICAYLEKTHPQPALYPADPADYARALWLEEFSDMPLRDAVSAIFFNKIVKPALYGEAGDESAIQNSLENLLPKALAYLDGKIGGNEYFVADRCSIADISISAQLRQLQLAGMTQELKKFSNLGNWAEKMFSRPSFTQAIALDEQLFENIRKKG